MRNEMNYLKSDANKILSGILDSIDEYIRFNGSTNTGDRELILSIEEQIRKRPTE
jgi:hypothetical protein